MPNQYATAQDLSQWMGEAALKAALNLPRTEALDLGHGSIVAALDAANDLADSRLRTRYALPLAHVPASLKQAVLIIARHNILIGRRADSLNDQDQNSIERAEDYLRAIGDGSQVIDVAGVVATFTPSDSIAVMPSQRTGLANPPWTEI